MLRGIIYLPFTLLFLAAITLGCGSQQIEVKEPEYANPIVETALRSISDGDYLTHAELFTPETRAQMPESVFRQGHELIMSKVGSYVDKEFFNVEEQGKYVIVFYQARFTEETNNVTVKAVFESVDGEMKLAGFWLDSPKLRD